VQKSSTVTLGGKEHEVNRAKLWRWLQLEDIREKIARAADRKDKIGFTALIYSYLSVALSVEDDFTSLPWYEIADAYIEIVRMNHPSTEFPLLRSVSENIEQVPWDYEGRTWYAWLNLISSAYGWSIEYVAELDVDDAIALVQEIRTTEQANREWEWARSELAYDRKGKHQKLPRPKWMERVPILPEGYKIKRYALPAGTIVSWREDGHTDD
jgi:hypothetical protein